MACQLVLMSDSATVVAYLKKQWGTVSLDMCRLTQEIIDWSELHLVYIMATHTPGKKNILADQVCHPDKVLLRECSLIF